MPAEEAKDEYVGKRQIVKIEQPNCLEALANLSFI
jgi:hypothetical protein